MNEPDEPDEMDEMDEMDDKWITNYNTKPIYSRLTITHLYINIDGVIDNQINHKYKLINNIISKREIEELIKENTNYNNKTYKLYFLSKFNINKSIIEQEQEQEQEEYFKNYNKIEDIVFEENGFYNVINTLYLIYHEKLQKTTYVPSLKIPYYTEKHLRLTRSNNSNNSKKTRAIKHNKK